jgi:hypothetical protein
MSHVTFDIGSGVAGGSVETRVPREVLVGSIKINGTVGRAEGYVHMKVTESLQSV